MGGRVLSVGAERWVGGWMGRERMDIWMGEWNVAKK